MDKLNRLLLWIVLGAIAVTILTLLPDTIQTLKEVIYGTL